MPASVKSILQIKPLQPVWRLMMRASLSGLRVGDHPRNQEFVLRFRRRFLRRMGFGNGASIASGGEQQVLRRLRPQLPDQPVIFDVGANQGNYLQTILGVFPRARVFCFEPTADAFALLSKAVPANSQVELSNFGFSDAEGQATIYADRQASGLASVYNRRLDHLGLTMEARGTIQLKTLDQFCASRKIDQIDLLKIDTEGHELKVLEGGQSMLARGAVSSIQFEFGGCNIASRTYFQDFWYLLAEQYRLYRILRDGLLPVLQYREEDEVFTATNYLALHRQRFEPWCGS